MGKRFPEHKTLDLPRVNREIMDQWMKEDTFKKSIDIRKGHPDFIFYEGPPSANGMPGIHHAMARTLKDIFCRYKTQKGFRVERKAGWDTHGLPVELSVEKKLKITKEDIGKTISIAEYNKECRKEVMKYTEQWEDLTHKLGYWVDMDHPYITYDNRYIETLWWILKEFYKKDLLYKGYTIQPFSPAAGTGLSSHELNQPGCYRDVKDTTVTALFKVIRNEKSQRFYLEDQRIRGSEDQENQNLEIKNQKSDSSLHGSRQAGISASLQNDVSPISDTTDSSSVKRPTSNVFIMAWTTTPWTLPSNTALAVGEKIRYVAIDTENPYTHEPIRVILAKELVASYFSEKTPYEVVMEFDGKDLEGVEYEQLLDWVRPQGEAFRVVLGDFVTTEDGTGIVHTAPTFGADDDRVSKKAGIAALLVKDLDGKIQPLVDRKGRFYPIEELDPDFVKAQVNEETYAPFAGRFVKEEYNDDPNPKADSTDVDIAVTLKTSGKAFKIEKHVHNYPHCWRTDKPVLYYPLDSWFIRTTAMKDRLIELNNTINWKPESTGTGRFGNWLENLVDWNLSRSRFWGTPLPIWRTEDGEEALCIGSVEELKNEIEKSVGMGFMKTNPLADFIPGDFSKENYDRFDLHRPHVDEVVLVSPSGQKMHREPDLIDVWFDSGAMPFAQLHYPFEQAETLDQKFPADFISEGVDQTRGWFYTLHAIAVLLKDSVSFKNLVSHGLVLDKEGNKMSKRLGNTVDPFATIEEFGSDALRWYMISNAPPWDNLKYDKTGVDEVRRKFFGTLYNTYAFFSLYANIDGFTYDEPEIPLEKRPEIDRWILSLLNSLILEVDGYMNDYFPTRSARAIQEFVLENLSNWYVRLNRKRFWGGDYDEDKISAYQTLYTCLETVAQLSAPFAPFYMDRLFLDLNKGTGRVHGGSVHLSDYPVADKNQIDKDLEERMGLAQRISSMVLGLRRKVNIKVRQPLARIMVPVLDPTFERRLHAVEEIIKTEINVKEIEYLKEASGILVKKIKPDFKQLGRKYGKLMKEVSAALAKFTQEDIAKIEADGEFTLELSEGAATLMLSEVEILSEDIPGWLVANDGNLTVALDITVTERLKQEGIARELVNRIQNLRKESGFEVTDKVTIQIQKHPDLNEAVEQFRDHIASQTLAESVELADEVDGKEMEISEGTITKLQVTRI